MGCLEGRGADLQNARRFDHSAAGFNWSRKQVEILFIFEEKGNETGESGLGRSWILQAAGCGEREEPSQQFD